MKILILALLTLHFLSAVQKNARSKQVEVMRALEQEVRGQGQTGCAQILTAKQDSPLMTG